MEAGTVIADNVAKVAQPPAVVPATVGLTPEQEVLLIKLQALKAHSDIQKPRCANCGSDLHLLCGSGGGR
jgi:hypothetical protein